MMFKRIAMLLFLCLSLCGVVHAQWHEVSTCGVKRFHVVQETGDVYAITENNGILKSIDGGVVWVPKNNGIDLSNPDIKSGLSCMANDNSGNIFLAVSYAWKFYRSSDGGDTWQETSATGFPTDRFAAMVFDSYTNALFLTSEGSGVYKSTDLGENWQSMWGDWYVYSIYSGKANASGTTGMLLIGTYYENLMKSVDGGATWNTKGGEYWLTSIISDPEDYLYAISDDAVYRSEDYGETWEKKFPSVNFGGPYVFMFYDEEHSRILAAGGSCTAEVKPILFYSSDRGETWESEQVSPGPDEISTDVAALPGGIIIVGTNKGIHRQGPPPPGDINGDFNVDISDVILCLRVAISLPVTIGEETYGPPDEYPQELIDIADMNDDKAVNISDVILILRKAIGLAEET